MKMWRCHGVPFPSTTMHVGGVERRDRQGAVDERVDEQARRGARARVSPGAAATSGEERGELEQQRERDEHADRRDAAAVEHGVREAREPEGSRDGDEEEHRPPLGETAVDEPVRGVVAAALRSPSGPSEAAAR